jgi:predicted nucleotidyltransferase component of viral defense system
MDVDQIISICLTAIYRNDLFNDKLYLKGGQAIRLKENIKTRFSADIDFSIEEKIEDPINFEDRLSQILSEEFDANNLNMFDFLMTRKPNIREEGLPDFWGGWQITFKLIQNSKKNLELDKKRREAIVPFKANSSKIEFDISEYEYCDSTETIKVGSVNVRTYSRVLLVAEKIRAICQQHPEYSYKGSGNRARDYYDIERLWNKVLLEKKVTPFLAECKKHLPGVFKAKEVELNLLEKIFSPSFVEIQESGWQGVKTTVTGPLQSFDYYNATLKDIVSKIRKI